jgi:hypothetical protein
VFGSTRPSGRRHSPPRPLPGDGRGLGGGDSIPRTASGVLFAYAASTGPRRRPFRAAQAFRSAERARIAAFSLSFVSAKGQCRSSGRRRRMVPIRVVRRRGAMDRKMTPHASSSRSAIPVDVSPRPVIRASAVVETHVYILAPALAESASRTSFAGSLTFGG